MTSSTSTHHQPAAMPAIRLQVMSDLHLETPRLFPMYGSFEVNPTAPYLALLGDIGVVQDNRLFQFIRAQLQQFEIVFYVLGNHEPYQDGDDSPGYENAIAKMRQFELLLAEQTQKGQSGHFVFLNRTRHDIDDTFTVLGCTLYSNITEAQKSTASLFVSDFSNIVGWDVDQHNAAHIKDVEWLNDQVQHISQEEPRRQIIILTHYCPTVSEEAHDPEHLEDPRNVMSAFATDLSEETCWKSEAVKAWAFGHTHHNCDFFESKTGKRIVANQRGYGREDLFDFDAEKALILHHE